MSCVFVVYDPVDLRFVCHGSAFMALGCQVRSLNGDGARKGKLRDSNGATRGIATRVRSDRTLRSGLLAVLRTEQEATRNKGHRYERSKGGPLGGGEVAVVQMGRTRHSPRLQWPFPPPACESMTKSHDEVPQTAQDKDCQLCSSAFLWTLAFLKSDSPDRFFSEATLDEVPPLLTLLEQAQDDVVTQHHQSWSHIVHRRRPLTCQISHVPLVRSFLLSELGVKTSVSTSVWLRHLRFKAQTIKQ